jgi:hypothetical protein
VLDFADRYLTLGAILASATVLTAIVAARKPLERPQRLLMVVLLGAIWSGWQAGRVSIHEAQFNALVHRQKTELEQGTLALAGDIGDFVRARGRTAPPPPVRATWERDVLALLRYDDETSALFEEKFGAQVRKVHDLLALEGIRDRDFDVFYRHPANAFQINVVAQKLIAMAQRLERS